MPSSPPTFEQSFADALRRTLPAGHFQKLVQAAQAQVAMEQAAAPKSASSEPQSPANPFAKYQGRPVEYVREVLGMEPTPTQAEILLALEQPPYRVIVESAHNVGKTALMAMAVNYRYDCYDTFAIITTAPTDKQVKQLLWAEIRLQRSRAKVQVPLDFTGGVAAEMRTHGEHFALGMVADKGEAFQGKHRQRMMFGFDEAEGLQDFYFTTTESMFKPIPGHAWLVILNPTTTTSAAFLEGQRLRSDGTPKWRVFTVSALDHPNIKAEARGEPAPIVNAIDTKQLLEYCEAWCDHIAAEVAGDEHDDFEFPPASGKWWRPGPIGCARILGRRPSQGINGVWSPGLWEKAERASAATFDLAIIPEIGCDCAWKGDDFTAFHVRWGPISLRAEAYNGWQAPRTAMHLKELCGWVAAEVNKLRDPQDAPLRPQQVPVKIDDDATGGAVIALAEDYRFVPVGATMKTYWQQRYPEKRSELWFTTKERAAKGELCLAGLPRDVRERLKIQCLAVLWEPTPSGQRKVEKKDKTKARIKRSPDDADAMNLAYCEWSGKGAQWVETADDGLTMAQRTNLMGVGQQTDRDQGRRERDRSERPIIFGRR